MASFVNHHKVVTKRSAFSALPSAQNGGESKGGVKSGSLKHQFSQAEGDLDLQKILKSVLIPNIRAPKKKVIIVINKYEEGEKLKKLGG
jgi:hypothetical protein